MKPENRFFWRVPKLLEPHTLASMPPAALLGENGPKVELPVGNPKCKAEAMYSSQVVAGEESDTKTAADEEHWTGQTEEEQG